MNAVNIVIPCYNEESRIAITDYRDFLVQNLADLTFVDDGSTDGTLTVLGELKRQFPRQVSVIHQEINTGKAEAVRNGILSALQMPGYEIIGFMDADLATPLAEVKNFLNGFDNEKTEFVFGSRIVRIGSSIRRLNYRHYCSRVVAKFVSLYLNIPIYDSQCGAKFFCRQLAATVFKELFVSKWLFDIEIFRRIDLAGKNIEECALELPLHVWIEKGESKIKVIDVVKIPLELYKIVLHYKPMKTIAGGSTPPPVSHPPVVIDEK